MRALGRSIPMVEPVAGRIRAPRALVSAPVRVSDGAGVLCAAVAGSLSDPEAPIAWTVDSYARVAAMMLSGGSLLERLRRSERHDALTGCLNYVALLDELGREIERALRHGHRLTCCFADLDHYKEINDRFGHIEGNRVLAAVGAALRGAVRSVDTVGRYGGDEFVVLLPGTGQRAAAALAQRMRGAIHRTPGTRGVDVSVGIAEWRPGLTAEALLAGADDALSAAKRQRGTVVLASP